jgi:hypothetical protein
MLRDLPRGQGKEEDMVVSRWGEGSMADCGPNGLRVLVGEGGSAKAMESERVVDSDGGEAWQGDREKTILGGESVKNQQVYSESRELLRWYFQVDGG